MSRITGTLTIVNRLGDLERAIMDVLWDTDTSLTVREVSARLTERNLAHTTVMTVLDRLAKKGFAKRERDGRAWRYCPAATRETYVTELMLTALDQTGDRTAVDQVRTVGIWHRGRGAARRAGSDRRQRRGR